MFIKVIILIVIFFLGIYCTWRQYEKKNYKGVAFVIIGSISIGIFTSWITDIMRPLLPYPDTSITSSVPIDDNEIDSTDNAEFIQPTSTPIDDNEIDSTANAEIVKPTENNKLTQMKNISDERSVNGSLVRENQKDEYVYVASTDGTYRFYTDLSSGGEVLIWLSDENSEKLKYGTNALTIDLEEGKTYILSIEYRNGPCDYTVSIGVPIPITDITGRTSISGSIVYRDQKDRYRYTAAITGTYRFDTNLSAAGEVRVRISGENGHSINDRTNALTIDLEKGKTYILSIEYRNGPCDYTVSIGVPTRITDNTGHTPISGSIGYRDQNDRYYIAPISGAYCFNANLSAGGEVRMRISGENGISLGYGTNKLTMNLKTGNKYFKC